MYDIAYFTLSSMYLLGKVVAQGILALPLLYSLWVNSREGGIHEFTQSLV